MYRVSSKNKRPDNHSGCLLHCDKVRLMNGVTDKPERSKWRSVRRRLHDFVLIDAAADFVREFGEDSSKNGIPGGEFTARN